MNFINAVTEPYVRFHEFRDSFDRNLRVAYGGLQVLRRTGQGPNGAEVGVLVEVPSGDEPWGPPRKWKNVPDLAAHATRFLSHMGVVRVASAFEDFLVNVKSEHDRFSALVGKPAATANDSGMDGLEALCQRLAWTMEPAGSLLPFFEYFSTARNCIVHRDGRANRALVDISTSDRFRSAIAVWNSGKERALPIFPKVEFNREIAFFPRHAVLASIVCNRLAHYLNGQLIQYLGDIGMTYMAAYHVWLAPEWRLTFPAKSADASVSRSLFERYCVKDFTGIELIRHLKSLDQWRPCYRRHDAVQRGLMKKSKA